MKTIIHRCTYLTSFAQTKAREIRTSNLFHVNLFPNLDSLNTSSGKLFSQSKFSDSKCQYEMSLVYHTFCNELIIILNAKNIIFAMCSKVSSKLTNQILNSNGKNPECVKDVFFSECHKHTCLGKEGNPSYANRS